ncbi:MAG: hypothetical protein A3K65_02070 [Euryarchaeota archaeon RBG_16_68_12]|nr:MAG: hypothetical protein A3K65_02070 [Euryarchaeota archaeon RBG_16_68_12]
MDEPLWDPREVRAVRRINRWTLAATGVLFLVGVVLIAAGASALGGFVLMIALLAFSVGTLAGMNATAAGRWIG